MLTNPRVGDALELSEIHVPAGLQVDRMEPEDYTDSSGEPALRVLVTIAESTDLDRLSGADVGELKASIRSSLRRHGIDLFPYIFLAKPSELAETEEE